MTLQDLEDGFTFFRIPEHLQGGLERYFLDRIRTGGFLESVLSGDRALALARADFRSAASIDNLFAFLENVAPSGSFGSADAVAAWLEPSR